LELNSQHEIYERARIRVQQKKRLYYHFVIFLIGSVFLIVINTVFGVGEKSFGDWFKYAVSLWFLIWILHFIHVFITTRFFGKDWVKKETENLIEKHKIRSEKLEDNLIKKGIITPEDKLPDSEKKSDKL
jgi:hypothetical protein